MNLVYFISVHKLTERKRADPRAPEGKYLNYSNLHRLLVMASGTTCLILVIYWAALHKVALARYVGFRRYFTGINHSVPSMLLFTEIYLMKIPFLTEHTKYVQYVGATYSIVNCFATYAYG